MVCSFNWGGICGWNSRQEAFWYQAVALLARPNQAPNGMRSILAGCGHWRGTGAGVGTCRRRPFQ